MGVVRTLLAFTGYSTLGVAGTWTLLTRNSRFVPVPPNDYLVGSTWYARLNPNNNQPLLDLCVRRVPLSKIEPALLEKEGRLVEAFCAGVWGGLGMWFPPPF